MTWSTPLTAVSNTPFTAAQYNASDRDNMLETPAAKFTAAGQLFVSTGANAGAVRTPTNAITAASETTASTSYTDLATIGPTVSVLTGAAALVVAYCNLTNNNASGFAFMSYAISGATSRAVSDAWAIQMAGTGNLRMSAMVLQTGLTPGVNVFTAKYRVSVA